MRRPVRPGQIYEDCDHHPVLCYAAEPVHNLAPSWRHPLRGLAWFPDDWDIMGISLLDGSRPRSCSARHCRPRRVSVDQAVSVRGAWEASQRAAERGEWKPWVNPFTRS